MLLRCMHPALFLSLTWWPVVVACVSAAQMLSGLMNWPQGAFASELKIDGSVRATPAPQRATATPTLPRCTPSVPLWRGLTLDTLAPTVLAQEATVTREVDGGLQTIKMPLPAVVSADLRLNVPRYIKLPDIVKARKKKIDTVNMDDMDVDTAPRLTCVPQLSRSKRVSAGAIAVADVCEGAGVTGSTRRWNRRSARAVVGCVPRAECCALSGTGVRCMP